MNHARTPENALHPGVKIILFLIFAVGANAFALPATLGCALVVGLVLLVNDHLRVALTMLWRLKWLFIMLFVLHGYYTPGPAVWPAVGIWSPSEPGLMLAIRRVMMLVVLVMAATWLLSSTARHDLAAGIAWLMRPLAWLGISSERFAVRLTIALKQAPLLIQSLHMRPTTSANESTRGSRIQAIAERCAAVIQQTENQAPVTIHLQAPRRLRISDFAAVVALAALVWGLAQL